MSRIEFQSTRPRGARLRGLEPPVQLNRKVLVREPNLAEAKFGGVFKRVVSGKPYGTRVWCVPRTAPDFACALQVRADRIRQ